MPPKTGAYSSCLPSDVTLSTIVNTDANGNKVTVDQKLKALGAYCSNAKLFDGNGKQIYFYHLQGCWGNPPADYQEIMQKQDAEIENLSKQYTVIQLTCNPSGKLIE